MLADMAYSVLYNTFGENPRTAERNLSPEDFFAKMGQVRKEIYTHTRFHSAIRDCIDALGFDNEQVAFDPARLRIIKGLSERLISLIE